MEVRKEELEKRNFLIFTNHDVVGIPRKDIHHNIRWLMKGIASAYQEALEAHEEAMKDKKFKKAVEEGRALTPLNQRLDIYLGDMNSINEDYGMQLKSGYKLHARKKDGKWKVGWKKFKSDEAVPVHVMNARPSYARTPMKEFSLLISNIAKKNDVPVTNPPEFALTSNIKSKTFKVLKGKLKTPQTELAYSDEEVVKAAGKINTDTVVVKEPTISGGKGVHFIKKEDVAGFLKKREIDYSDGVVVQEFLPAIKKNIMRIWTSVIKGSDGKTYTDIIGAIGNQGEPGGVIEPFKVETKEPRFLKVRDIAHKAVKELAKSTNTYPHFVGVDVGFDEKGEPVFLEVGNYADFITPIRKVDKGLLKKVGRSFLTAGLLTRRR